jgi:hypothetical protein
MLSLLIACEACTKRVHAADGWKHRQWQRNMAVYYTTRDNTMYACPDGFTLDKRCSWTIIGTGAASAYMCPEWLKEWKSRGKLGVAYLDAKQQIMYSEKPAEDIYTKLANQGEQKPVLPQDVTIPPLNGRTTLPAGYRAEMQAAEAVHKQEMTEASARHNKENVEIERRFRTSIREIAQRWGQKAPR